MAKIEEKIEQLAGPIIESLGYDLYDVEYAKEGKNYFLRIYIDNKKGIDLEDCEKVSNELTEALDKEDPIKEQYFLEVSSPGIERVLKKDKHLKANLNNQVQVKLFKAIDKEKQFIGILDGFDRDIIILKLDSEKIELNRNNIAQIKTIYNW